jgi:hypothetical protein
MFRAEFKMFNQSVFAKRLIQKTNRASLEHLFSRPLVWKGRYEYYYGHAVSVGS